MKLLSNCEISAWAYCQCRNNIQEIRDLITDSWHAYLYCKYIEDSEDMWRKITDFYWAKNYCRHVKDRPEVRKYCK